MTKTTNLTKYENQNKIQKYLIDRFFNSIFIIIKSLKVTKVLDLGCGEGFFAQKLAKKFPKIKLTGLDISYAALSHFKKLNPQLKCTRGSIYKLPFLDKPFDLIICLEVLEHLKRPDIALREIKRVMKKYAIISVPNEPYYRLTNLARGKYIKDFGNHPEHIQNWNKKSYLKLINKFFKIKKFKTSFPWQIVLITK